MTGEPAKRRRRREDGRALFLGGRARDGDGQRKPVGGDAHGGEEEGEMEGEEEEEVGVRTLNKKTSDLRTDREPPRRAFLKAAALGDF
jgi:hypothetical protein